MNHARIIIVVAFVLALGVGAALRIPQLELRPVHGDEANQAVKTGMLFEGEGYAYDPHEHHGPTLYYLTLPVLWLSGASSFAETTITHYRIVTVLFGLLLILLLWPMKDLLGPWGMVWAALFIAVSHGMTFYSRYYVQEMLLVCFTQGCLVASWRYLRRPHIGYALLLGLCLGLTHATKETSALIVLSVLIAGGGALLYGRWRDGCFLSECFSWTQTPHVGRHVAAVGVVAAFVSITLFTSFFSHPRGPLDALLTYIHYVPRVEGEGTAGVHDKPWHYYLGLLLYTWRQAGPRWSEALVLFAAFAGGIVALWPTQVVDASANGKVGQVMVFRRFLAFYALTATLVYALIPYKTPWNLLVFYHPLLLLAGLGTASIIRRGRWRLVQVLLCLLLLVGAGRMGYQSWQGNFIYHADARNPYVYAHPSTALRRLTGRIADIAAVSRHDRDLHINIIRPDGDYWPLPWYLRGYTRTGWWRSMPVNADAAIILAAPELYELLMEQLHETYFVEFHALRPGVLLHAYIRQDLWDAFMATRQ